MKFDAVVGNPPYQESNSDRRRDDSIYHLFIDESCKLANKFSIICPARFLFNVGSTPVEWNRKILNDKHVNVDYYEENSFKVFPDTDIKGGVVVLHRDNEKTFGAIGSFTVYKELNSILKKVEKKNNLPEFGTLMFVQNKFKLEKLYEDFPEFRNRLSSNGNERRLTSSIFDLLPEMFFDTKPNDENYIRIYGRQENERKYKYIKTEYLEESKNISKYKVFVTAANGSGEFGETLSSPIIGEPITGHTQTFISIGEFDTNFEAESMFKYLKCKFSRAMLGVLKVTQNNKTKDVWSKIPLQNFTSKSDIDWSKSIPEIGEQLYKKYNLNQEEISFIESMIKPME